MANAPIHRGLRDRHRRLEGLERLSHQGWIVLNVYWNLREQLRMQKRFVKAVESTPNETPVKVSENCVVPSPNASDSDATRLEERLDEALDESFPASDPVAVHPIVTGVP